MRFKLTMIIAAIAMIVSLFQNCGGPASSASFTADKVKASGPDVDPPRLIVLSKPPAYVKSADVEFQLVAKDDGVGVSHIEYKANDGEWRKTGNVVRFEGLGPGAHRAQFRAVDMKGNYSEVFVHNWATDDDLPQIVLSQKPAQLSTATSATLKFAITDVTSVVKIRECYFDGAAQNCASGTVTKTGLSLGMHSFALAVEDEAGNEATLEYSWAVIAATGEVPAPVFTVSPAPFENGSTSKIAIQALDITQIPNSKLLCKFNGVDHACASGQEIILPVTERKNSSGALIQHQFTAQFEISGKKSTASTVSWYIDKTLPTLKFLTKPAASIMQSQATIKFQASDNSGNFESIVCTLDGVARACENNVDLVVQDLSKGLHAFHVVAIDKAGNKAEITTAWENPSCDINDLSFRWPVNGGEGANWAMMSYYDNDRRSGHITDFGANSGDLARAYDQSSGISLTTGDYTTLESEYARVYAMEKGVVTAVRSNEPDNQVYPSGASLNACNSGSAKANYIDILHDNGFKTRYTYLRRGIPFTVGSIVKKGDFIGVVGNSGCVSIPQVLVTTLNCEGSAIDPVKNAMFDRGVSYETPIKFLNFTMQQGDISSSTEAGWRKLILTPVHTRTYARNSDITVSAYISGGHSSDVIRYLLYRPNGHAAYSRNVERGNSVGQFKIVKFHDLDTPGTWRWKIQHVKNAGGNAEVIVPIIDQTFTVN